MMDLHRLHHPQSCPVKSEVAPSADGHWSGPSSGHPRPRVFMGLMGLISSSCRKVVKRDGLRWRDGMLFEDHGHMKSIQRLPFCVAPSPQAVGIARQPAPKTTPDVLSPAEWFMIQLFIVTFSFVKWCNSLTNSNLLADKLTRKTLRSWNKQKIHWWRLQRLPGDKAGLQA